MKRVVGSDAGMGVLAGVVSLLVVALTGASAGATYLITLGFSMIAVAIRLGPERMQLWREKHPRAR